jgi:hypothetical protein
MEGHDEFAKDRGAVGVGDGRDLRRRLGGARGAREGGEGKDRREDPEGG